MNDFVRRISGWEPGQPREIILSFVESIFSQYLNTTEDHRQSIREAVRANRTLWNPAGQDDIDIYLSAQRLSVDSDIVPLLRATLVCISITGGGQWQDTLASIESLRNEAIMQQIDIRPHVIEIAATADHKDRRGGENGEMSTRDLILWILMVPENVSKEALLQQRKSTLAQAAAEEEWGGKMRACPHCSTTFVSNFDLGQCPQCRKHFRASTLMR